MSQPTPPRSASHIAPLLWHHGEPAEVIVREIDAMFSSGIREFVVEPRPHPDFLGEQWWHDMDVVLDTARERGMRVWFFDDARFPSGWLNGILPAQHPHMLKRYLAESHVDVTGPARGASFALRPWLHDGDRMHAVVAARRDSDTTLDSGTLIDITAAVVDDTLYWDVPEGRWRVVVITETSRGHEPETSEYLNPIAEGAAGLHLDTVHRPHHDHYAADFGGVIAGFFQDEPRFGNAKTYEFRLGQTQERLWDADTSYVLPFSDLLGAKLGQRWGADAGLLLPLLWWDGDEAVTARVRFAYMDELTRLYERFQRELGAWCEERGVSLIGHVVEDNGAHARLGYGPGHFFRAQAGQHMGGIDIVDQHVRPGAMTGRRAGSFGDYDDDFYFWGLSKLASSAAHIDPLKRGLAMCEAFGAYGWHAGLRLMKLLTDHMAVRGINFLVPHAFSPITWDPDCPPHFFNGGLNPQWVHFPLWRDYAERLSAALSDGTHVSDAAILYHAEAEWAGDHMPFQRVMAELQRVQLDADVVPIDAVLASEPTLDGSLRIGSETYPVLIVPYAQRLPSSLIETLLERGTRTIFVDALPTGWADAAAPELLARLAASARVVELANVAAALDGGVSASGYSPDLRVLRYEKDGAVTVFVVNESKYDSVDTRLRLPVAADTAVIFDPLSGRRTVAESSPHEQSLEVRVRLAPGESRFLEFPDGPVDHEPEFSWAALRELPSTGWSISTRSFDADGWTPTLLDDLGPLNVPGRLPQFAGSIRYERRADLSDAGALDLGAVGETVELRVNGASLGVRFAGPYRFELNDAIGECTLTIDVTTTLAPALANLTVFDASAALEPMGLLGPVTTERRAP